MNQLRQISINFSIITRLKWMAVSIYVWFVFVFHLFCQHLIKLCAFFGILITVLKNSLRGYPLNGCEFKVPESHRGVVFQEDQRPLDENAERTYKVAGIFNEFIYWNYDKQPSDNDKLKQALIWNNLAEAVSSRK